MVAYNLMLAVFPFALLVLFVFGQVLKIKGVETGVLDDLQRLFPNTEQQTLTDVLERIEDNSTTIGIAAFLGSLWIGASFWGAMDTAFGRIYHVATRGWLEQKRFSFAMLGVVLLFIAASILLPTLEAALASSTDRLPFGLSHIKAIDTALLLAWRCWSSSASAASSTGRCRRATCPGATSGPARLRHRRRRRRQLGLPLLPLERLQPLALRLDPRLRPHRPALVLPAQPGAAGRRDDQLAAPRAARHGGAALYGRLIVAKCAESDSASGGRRGRTPPAVALSLVMPANDPIHADDPGRRRNVYGATMEQAMHAGSTDARLDALGAKIDDLAHNIDKRFEQVDKRFEQVDKRFEQVDKRFERMDRRLESLENRFTQMQLTLMGGFLAVIAALLAAPHL